MKKVRFIVVLLVALLCVSALVACSTETAPDSEALTYVSLRINPEIEMLTDEDGNVVDVNAVNEDGEVVLSVLDPVGMNVEDAGVAFTETAEDLGYFNPDGEKDTVYIGVESTTDGVDETMREKLNKSILDYFKNKGINGKVSKETLDKYAEKAAEWGISAGHVKLVMRVLDAHPELSDTEVLEMEVKQLLRLLKGEKEEKIAAGLKNEYRRKIDALEQEHSRLFELRREIEDLEARLDGELTEAEKSEIRAQISDKEAEMKPLSDAYKEAVVAVKTEYKSASKSARDAYKKEAERRKAEHSKQK